MTALSVTNIVKNEYTSYRNIISIAWPVMLGSLGQNIVYLVDNSFIGRVSEVQFGASAIGGIFYFFLFMIGFGFNTGMQVMVARRKGEGNVAAIGEVLDHQLRLIVVFAALAFVVMHYLSAEILPAMVQSPEVGEKAIVFLHYRSFGIFCGLINSCFMAYFVGIGNTRVTLWSTGVLVAVNVFLLYALVFGNFGFPRMEIGGAGLASTIAEATVTIVFLIYIHAKKLKRDYQLFRFAKIKFALYGQMIRLAIPLVFQQVISVGSWWLFFLSIEHLGEQSLAISNLVRSLYAFYGIPVWALASTTNSMTSNLIGQGKADDVIPLVKKIAVVSVIFSLVFLILINLFPVQTFSVYTNDKDLILASIPSLRSLSLAIFLFSFSILTIYAVSGTGATNVSLIIEVIAIVMYVAYTVVSAIIYQWSLPVIWLAETLYWITTFGMCAWYLANGKWRLKKV